MVENEFMDVNQLKSTYLHGISDYLSTLGYAVIHVDNSDWYSYEQKLLVDTNAPEPYISKALDDLNKKLKNAYGVLVQ